MKIRIVLAVLILSLLAGTVTAQAGDKKQTRDRKKVHLKTNDADKCDPVRQIKRDRLNKDPEAQFNAFFKKIFGGEGPQQDKTQTRDRKKVCDPQCDPECTDECVKKQDQTRDQKQDGTCDDQDVNKEKEDGEPDQDKTQTRDRKKVCDPQCDPESTDECEKDGAMLRILKRDRLDTLSK